MLISVCMATFNGARFLREQVDSILQQEFQDFHDVELELIVSDDASTDHTLEILKSYEDERIRIFHHQHSRRHRYYKALFAASENFENAILQARGEYIFLADQDDIWYPNHIETLLHALTEHKMVAGSFDRIDESGNFLCTTLCHAKSFGQMCRKFPYFGFTMAFHRSLLLCFLPFPVVPQHDVFMGLVAKRLGHFNVLTKPVTCAHRQLKGWANTSYTGFNVPMYAKIYYKTKMTVSALWRSVVTNVVK